MKIKELIEKLSQYDENLDVYVDYDSYQMDIEGFEYQKRNEGLVNEEDTQVLVILYG